MTRLAAAALAVVVGWNFTAVGAAAIPLAEAMGTGLAVAGLLTTVLLLTEALVLVPAGRRIDRVGPRRVALAGLGVLIVADALAVITPAPALLIGARALVGAGLALAFAAALLLWPGATGQGLVGGLALAGAGLAVAVVPLLDGPLGWRAPFVPELVLAALAVPVVWRARDPATATPRAPIGLRTLLATPGVAGNVVAVTFGFVASFAVGAWVVPLLTRSEHFGTAAAGLAGSLVLFGGMLTRPLGGAADRGRPGLVRPVSIASVLAASLALIVLGLGLGVVAGVAAALVAGLAGGFPFAPGNAGVARAVPQAAGTAVGLANAVATLAGVVVVFVIGLAFEAGQGPAAFVALGILLLGALPLLPRARRA
ncbi:MAG: MFS transporter [Thermoleophilia bacterium]|jgi:MFS family permease|nr:MFS transporter [Thermoleophilia bacterium]